VGHTVNNEGVVKPIHSLLTKLFPDWLPEDFMSVWEQYIYFFIFVIFLITNVNSMLKNIQTAFKRVLKNYAYTFGVSTLMIVASYVPYTNTIVDSGIFLGECNNNGIKSPTKRIVTTK